jgi:MHS family proline/betaine transporter-like MFS transporter
VEAFARYPRYMLVGIAIAAGHAVLAYTATGYIFTYLTNVTKLDPISANLAVGVAGLLQLPFYIFNAWLSDKVGRRRIYMTGLLFAMATYYPVYLWLAGVKDVFGGFTPLIIQAIGLWLKNPLAGVILYTYVVAAVALITALLLLPETKDKTLD